MTDRDASRRDEDRLEQALVADGARALEIALEQKTKLLLELDHRTKNSLQLIASLIQLQSRRIDDPLAQAAMKALLGRVSAVATVHRNLLEVNGAAAFDVAAVMRNVAGDLVEASGREDVALRFDLAPLIMPAVSAAPIALIVHELVGNALAHAFPDRPGAIALALRSEGDGHEIEVSDDGTGVSAAPCAGFGLTLVDLLARQLGARVEPAAGPGHTVRITLPRARDVPRA